MADEQSTAVNVFISYTHDTPEHEDRVWELSERLRGDGIDCRLDQQEESPAEGWPRWCRNRIKEARFVLVVCTEPISSVTQVRTNPPRASAASGKATSLRKSCTTLRQRTQSSSRSSFPQTRLSRFPSNFTAPPTTT